MTPSYTLLGHLYIHTVFFPRIPIRLIPVFHSYFSWPADFRYRPESKKKYLDLEKKSNTFSLDTIITRFRIYIILCGYVFSNIILLCMQTWTIKEEGSFPESLNYNSSDNLTSHSITYFLVIIWGDVLKCAFEANTNCGDRKPQRNLSVLSCFFFKA